jgi:acetyltransferase
MDRPDRIALLAFADALETEVIAEAMLVKARDGQRWEIALSVADAWQGVGMGTLLLRHLECRARTLGARFLFGDVLRTNTAMTRLARKEGLSIRTCPADARLVEIGKDLAVLPPGLPCAARPAPAGWSADVEPGKPMSARPDLCGTVQA